MKYAATLLSLTDHPGVITTGFAHVLINNLPAARVSDEHACLMPPSSGPHPPNKILKGSKTVLIGGKPAARVDDKTVCGAAITTGSPNVLIGD